MSRRGRSPVVGIGAGLVAFAVVFLLLRDFEPNQRRIGAIFALTVVWWMTEALPLGVTALVSTALLVIVGGVEEKTAFGAYGDPIVPLFIGSFILAKGIETTGLSERLAWLILKRPGASRTPGRLLLSLGLISCVISLFVSNTATTAMMLPIGLSILHTLKVDARGAPFSIAALLMLTWGSSVAVGVPVGTPPNLIGISLIEKATGTTISFTQWMTFGMPVTLLMLLGAWVVLQAMYGKGAPATAVEPEMARQEVARLGRMSGSERAALIAFLVAIGLWLMPDTTGIVLGADHPMAKWLSGHVPPSVAALVAAALLFVLPAKDAESGHAMTWRQASTIEWGTILLFGGGIALGQATFSSGLAKDLGDMAAQVSGANSVWAITALCIALAIALSELASNTAAATTMVPVAIGLAQGAGVSPIAPALGVAIGASLGFMLPVSTAPNAIVYSSGLIPPRQMMRAGFVIDLLGFLVTLGVLRLVLPLMGLA